MVYPGRDRAPPMRKGGRPSSWADAFRFDGDRKVSCPEIQSGACYEPKRLEDPDTPPDRSPGRAALFRDDMVQDHALRTIGGEGLNRPRANSSPRAGLAGRVRASKLTLCPSRGVPMPERSKALMCKNTSLPPPSNSTNPKPFAALNHFTVPEGARLFLGAFGFGAFLAPPLSAGLRPAISDFCF